MLRVRNPTRRKFALNTQRLIAGLMAAVVATLPLNATGQRLPQPDELGSQIKVVDRPLAWDLAGFDNVLVVKIKLKNTASIPLKDFVIGCIAVAESGTVVGMPKTTLYQALKPGETKTYPRVNVGLVNSQTAQVGCDVLSASRQH